MKTLAFFTSLLSREKDASRLETCFCVDVTRNGDKTEITPIDYDPVAIPGFPRKRTKWNGHGPKRWRLPRLRATSVWD
jgi:hypothetical protein